MKIDNIYCSVQLTDYGKQFLKQRFSHIYEQYYSELCNVLLIKFTPFMRVFSDERCVFECFVDNDIQFLPIKEE